MNAIAVSTTFLFVGSGAIIENIILKYDGCCQNMWYAVSETALYLKKIMIQVLPRIDRYHKAWIRFACVDDEYVDPD